MHKTAQTHVDVQQLRLDLNNSRAKNAELQDAVRLARARATDADVNLREMEEEMIRQVHLQCYIQADTKEYVC